MDPPIVTSLPSQYKDVYGDHLLVRYPWTGLVISIMYLILIKILNQYMKNRPAYNLKTIMRIYNVIQVVLCGKLVHMSMSSVIWSAYILGKCPPDDFSTPFYVSLQEIGLLYISLKIFDFCDTVFIVLRKKEAHLSFLHLFHHSTMVVLTISGYSEGEALGLPTTVINSFVHMVMYTYYFIASLENQRWISKYKKYVTQLQLIQFVVLGGNLFFAIYVGCQWKRQSVIIGSIVLIVILFEFGRFYINNYSSKPKQKEK